MTSLPLPMSETGAFAASAMLPNNTANQNVGLMMKKEKKKAEINSKETIKCSSNNSSRVEEDAKGCRRCKDRQKTN